MMAESLSVFQGEEKTQCLWANCGDFSMFDICFEMWVLPLSFLTRQLFCYSTQCFNKP